MKKLLIIFIIIILAASAGIIYLNQTILPTKMKAAIVAGLEDLTQKKVLLGSVQLSIFKGLVFKDLIISGELNAIINVKEAHCSFLLLPLFNKQMIISHMVFESPDIFIEREKDNSINILGLFSRKGAAKAGFRILIRRVSVKKATLIFHDLTLEPLYAKEIKSLDAEVQFLLPAKVRYNTRFDIPSDSPIRVDSSGEYSIMTKELTAEIRLKGFIPKEFIRYYEDTEFSFPEGKFDSILNLKYKDAILSVDAESETTGLEFFKDDISVNIAGSERSNVRYDFAQKKIEYTGNVNIKDMAIDGIEYIDRIDNIKGRIEFSNLSLSSDNMTATVLGLPVEAKLSMGDLNNSILNIDASSDIGLAFFQDMLRTRFDLNAPADFSGDAKLRLAIKYPVKAPEEAQVKSTLYTLNASVKINQGKDILENVTGRFQIVPNQVSWDDVEFRYHDIHYKSSGILTNFKTPGIQLKLASKDISLNAVFALNDKVMNFSKFSGKYLNSDISATGVLDASDPARLKTDITGVLNVDLEDLKSALAKFKDKFYRVKPKGIVRAEFSLKGDPKDLKNCAIDANLSSDSLSLYGFRLATSTMN